MSVAENPTTPYAIHEGPWQVLDLTHDDAFAPARTSLARIIQDTHIATIHTVAAKHLDQEASPSNHPVADVTILRPMRIPRTPLSGDAPQTKHVMEGMVSKTARRLGGRVLTQVGVPLPAVTLSENLYALVRGPVPEAAALVSQTDNEPLGRAMDWLLKENKARAYPTGLAFVAVSGMAAAIGSQVNQQTAGLTRLRPMSMGYFDLGKGQRVTYSFPVLSRLREARRATISEHSALTVNIGKNPKLGQPYL